MATNRQDDEEHREESLNRPVQESPLNDELDDDIERQLPLPEGKAINIAVSSRALFDLEEEHEVFTRRGLQEYIELQISREDVIMEKGSAFPFIEALQNVNTKLKQKNPDEEELFSASLMSHNSGEVAIRLQNSIEHYGLKIDGMALISSTLVPYLKPFEIALFLSSYEEEVTEALKEGFAAAVMSLQKMNSPDSTQLRIAFHLDVMFADKNKEDSEYYAAQGPLKKFAEAIGRMQKKLTNVKPCPIRTYVLSASDASKVQSRALTTFRNWGLRFDEYFTKKDLKIDEVLKIIKPHIYFNNKDADVKSAREKGTPTGYVKGGEHGDEKTK